MIYKKLPLTRINAANFIAKDLLFHLNYLTPKKLVIPLKAYKTYVQVYSFMFPILDNHIIDMQYNQANGKQNYVDVYDNNSAIELDVVKTFLLEQELV